MTEREQVRPLAPASERQISSDEEEVALVTHQKGRRKCIKCCGIIAALLLIKAIVVVVLIFTVFKVKDPIIYLNGVTIDKIDLTNGTTPTPGSNLTLTADVSVKNANYASFRYMLKQRLSRYSNTTTTIFYHGSVIGEARGPPGLARARRTARMNITVDIITDDLVSDPMLSRDISTGLLQMTSYTRVGGKVKILKLVKKHVVVKMNCSMTINTTSQSIQDQNCRRKVKL